MKKFILPRLPTGHTHEDIDYCFGTLKSFATSEFQRPCPFCQVYHKLETQNNGDFNQFLLPLSFLSGVKLLTGQTLLRRS